MGAFGPWVLALAPALVGAQSGEVAPGAPRPEDESPQRESRAVVELHPNGVVATQGTLVLEDGKFVEQGVWECFGLDGAPLSHGSYELGRATGEWTFWHALSAGSEPSVRLRCAYEDGLLHGAWWSSYPGPDGRTAETGSYLHGEPDGPWSWWWPTGTPRATAVYQDGQLHGPFEVFHDSGKPAERGKYVDGERDGVWEAWHDNGQLALWESWKAGLRDGASESYYADGVLESKGSYSAGGRTGLWSFFHADGGIAERGEFENGRAEGPWKSWYPGGAIEAEGSYVDGLADGDWVTWDPEGNLTGRPEYARGRRLAASDSSSR